jgi:hypothetical protein
MPEGWLADLRDRFGFNLGRVDGIIEAYDRLGTAGPGRQSVQRTDLLRSAVVFLHASLEDLLRSLAEQRLPLSGLDILERVPLPGSAADKPLFKFTLKDLATFRGEDVESVIRRAVSSYLRHSNYNSTAEIAYLLREMGVHEVTGLLAPYAGRIESMMSRRHLIVHRADRNPVSGRGQHSAASISRETVQRWSEAVRAFGDDLLDRFTDK